MRHRIAIVLTYLAFVGALAGGVWWIGMGTAQGQLARRGEADLALAADRLTNALQRYRQLAVVMADHPDLAPLLSGQGDATRARAVLVSVADQTGAMDIVLVDAAGREIVAASDTAPNAHAGQPALIRAMQGALGVDHQLDPRYGRRGFTFAAPIFSPAGPVIGALIVIADAEAVEAAWRGDNPVIFFTDDLGVVYLTNRSELLFRSRSGDPLRAAASNRYRAGQVVPFVAQTETRPHGHDIWQVDGGRYLPRTALHLTRDIPTIGMIGEALLDIAPARQIAGLQAAVTAALCLAFGALLFLATERRRTLALANQRLEARVADRTADLSALNVDLRREVVERTDAEARLTRAQADLVQAGKLSALGQMSAGISHELNQPLTAIRSFAQNGQGFLARGRPEIAAQNLGRIAELADRMARIIRNLRAFARQESVPLGDVDLVGVIDVVLELAAPKLRDAGVAVLWQPPAQTIIVRAGEVRLQQVILNLVTNAIDAMVGCDPRHIDITLDGQERRIALSVRDTGPGITEPDRIFDPFYTTKEVGADEGMGLGLSISYGLVQSFGGAIRGRNHPDGGAVFTVELDAVSILVAA